MYLHHEAQVPKRHSGRFGGLEAKAEEVSQLLTAMANAKRLLVLCNLLDTEKSVGELAEIVDLSSAALSQHLSKMRAQRLVATRRDGQTIYYQLASPEVRELLQTLYRLYCEPR
ncbi:metalloregulator ArsR/SmtB family transcription factor [Bradyrhizobium sp. ARR65]|uniref:ArsR/SmtB family transcription factor n=1 Tax=Bradyrhizobium sp. ARR65 TaxID=1040989 RepID=UPI000465AC98|nr:metalloregulator ArsR/SmtB family transcription factor [Bradyrhizobium sp. ARR65]